MKSELENHLFLFLDFYIYSSFYVYEYGSMHANEHVWWSEDCLWELVLFMWAPGNQTQIVKVRSKLPCPLYHLAYPVFLELITL